MTMNKNAHTRDGYRFTPRQKATLRTMLAADEEEDDGEPDFDNIDQTDTDTDNGADTEVDVPELEQAISDAIDEQADAQEVAPEDVADALVSDIEDGTIDTEDIDPTVKEAMYRVASYRSAAPNIGEAAKKVQNAVKGVGGQAAGAGKFVGDKVQNAAKAVGNKAVDAGKAYVEPLQNDIGRRTKMKNLGAAGSKGRRSIDKSIVKDVGRMAVPVAGAGAVGAGAVGYNRKKRQEAQHEAHLMRQAAINPGEAVKKVQNAAKGIGSKAVGAGKAVGGKAQSGAKAVGNKAMQTAKTVGDSTVSTVKDFGSTAKNVGKDIGRGTRDTAKNVGADITAFDSKHPVAGIAGAGLAGAGAGAGLGLGADYGAGVYDKKKGRKKLTDAYSDRRSSNAILDSPYRAYDKGYDRVKKAATDDMPQAIDAGTGDSDMPQGIDSGLMQYPSNPDSDDQLDSSMGEQGNAQVTETPAVDYPGDEVNQDSTDDDLVGQKTASMRHFAMYHLAQEIAENAADAKDSVDAVLDAVEQEGYETPQELEDASDALAEVIDTATDAQQEIVENATEQAGPEPDEDEGYNEDEPRETVASFIKGTRLARVMKAHGCVGANANDVDLATGFQRTYSLNTMDAMLDVLDKVGSAESDAPIVRPVRKQASLTHIASGDAEDLIL